MMFFDANLMVDLLRIECARRAADRERRRENPRPAPEAAADEGGGAESRVRNLWGRLRGPAFRRR